MKREYSCAKCDCRFPIDLTQLEADSSLNDDRSDRCPSCSQWVGMGVVQCMRCAHEFELRFPHWHVHCNLARGPCPRCASDYVSPCIC
jgi:DNA-directed RNA polymerase subunit RPC12/RpoP